MRFVYPFGMFLNLGFMTVGFANIVVLQLAQVNAYTRKDSKSFRIQSFYQIISNFE